MKTQNRYADSMSWNQLKKKLKPGDKIVWLYYGDRHKGTVIYFDGSDLKVKWDSGGDQWLTVRECGFDRYDHDHVGFNEGTRWLEMDKPEYEIKFRDTIENTLRRRFGGGVTFNEETPINGTVTINSSEYKYTLNGNMVEIDR